MKIEILDELPSTLPSDDTHRYRSGAWKPQNVERKAWDMPVQGEIPTDLAGVYLRNTENPLHDSVQQYHPFDGDAMIHSINFADGEAVYHNRFVRTPGLLAELEAQRSLWAGCAEPSSVAEREGCSTHGHMKDAASTDVVVHQGKAIASFWQCGELHQMDPVSLEAAGLTQWPGMPARGISAHTKVDEITGELLWFSYGIEKPYLQVGSVNATGGVEFQRDVEMAGPRLPHDMAFTENYLIVNDCPLYLEQGAIDSGVYGPRFHADEPTRFGLVPRSGDGTVRWFDAEPTFVLHWINAYEDGNEVVLDGFFQRNPSPAVNPEASFEDNVFRYLDMYQLQPEVRRWRFNLDTGRTVEETLSDRVTEFGMINGRYGGRPYRYSYNALPCEGWFGFRGLIKHDVVSGTETVYELPEGVHNSETVMAPREGSQAEDDGYLVTFVSDMNDDSSSCMIFDAADPAAGPVATIGLPERIASGTHATWAPASALS